jgi:hypothetical protein
LPSLIWTMSCGHAETVSATWPPSRSITRRRRPASIRTARPSWAGTCKDSATTRYPEDPGVGPGVDRLVHVVPSNLPPSTAQLERLSSHNPRWWFYSLGTSGSRSTTTLALTRQASTRRSTTLRPPRRLQSRNRVNAPHRGRRDGQTPATTSGLKSRSELNRALRRGARPPCGQPGGRRPKTT